MTPSERKRLEAVMPFYVNGSADEHDRAFVEGLRHEVEVQAMLAWHETLAEKVQTQVHAVNDHIGWAQLMGKVRASNKPVAKEVSGWHVWLSLDRWLARPFQGPAFAALALVVVGQSVLLYRNNEPLTTDEGYGAVRGQAPSDLGPVSGREALTINFKDETSEHDMRMLLIATGANIVQGPGQLGDYIVHVPADRVDIAFQELRMSKWVNSVRRVQPAISNR